MLCSGPLYLLYSLLKPEAWSYKTVEHLLLSTPIYLNFFHSLHKYLITLMWTDTALGSTEYVTTLPEVAGRGNVTLVEPSGAWHHANHHSSHLPYPLQSVIITLLMICATVMTKPKQTTAMAWLLNNCTLSLILHQYL